MMLFFFEVSSIFLWHNTLFTKAFNLNNKKENRIAMLCSVFNYLILLINFR